ncbi:MAG TPA: zinc-dependent metalloprotease [Burkholderiaceae bacterium]|nr:zinc-dependent metalloprotease [Burkholderiaceae bacterium]
MKQSFRVVSAALAVAALSACATINANGDTAAAVAATSASAMPSPVAPTRAASGGAARPAGAGVAPAAAANTAAAAPGSPRPFADVIKDAKRTDGLFPIWQKDDKTWIEIPESLLSTPFFLSVNMSRGIGERFLFAGLMGNPWFGAGGEYVAEFRKAGGNIQLLARNTTFLAKAGSPEARAVKKSFSDSLLGSAPVASQPHPERKSVLIDANALLMTDIPRASNLIERMYRNSYQFDPRNSYIQSAKSNADRMVIDVTAHYAQPRIPVQAPTQPGAQPGPFYPPPAVLEDPRSMFLGFLYTFTKLPESPMAPRIADSRIGHFTTAKVDFSDESRFSPVRFYVNRWRLEKKDPGADVSEPVKPITFWLSNEIPERHREPIRQGILEWNKAFEKAGFRNAIVVKQQPDDADFDLGETQYSSIRWMPTATPSFGAIGPAQVDPRSGEILDADIGWDANMVRGVRSLKTDGVIAYQPMYDEATGHVHRDAAGADSRLCSYRDLAAREVGFALALLEARGELDPDSPEADKLVADFLRDITMHEVGHTLGLRHNFRASTAATQAQLADPLYAAKNGLTGSVMEYSPVNLALKGEKQGAYFTPTLGAYDYWAVEYAYKPIAPDREQAELAKIASRSSEPQLAFATDEDIGFSIDPLVNQGDLGNDPLGFYKRRVKLSQELWQRLEQRQLPAGESYSVLRRRFLTGFVQLGGAMASAAKYVGGAELVNDYAGSERMPVTPISAKKQREALATITEGLLKSDSFKVSPSFMRKLVADRLERDALSVSNPQAAMATVELALPDRVLVVQRDVLNRLMSPVVARRVVENSVRGVDGDVFTLSELFGTVQNAVWDEARRGVEADPLRRNLQREHLRRMTAAVLGSSAGYPADARALLRRDARQLRDWLDAAAKKPGLSAETRAHYAESAETLREALRAPMLRSGV